MKTLNFTFNREGVTLEKEDKNRDDVDVMVTVIENVVMAYANQQRGLLTGERKLYYLIDQKLREAKKNMSLLIELEDQEAGFLKKCFREARLVPALLLSRVEEAIERDLKNDK